MRTKVKQTVYLCPKCDREYFSMSRDEWDNDRVANDNLAKVAKEQHKCPWELRKMRRKSNG